MSPRVIHIPLSGGDRKSLAKNLRYAEQAFQAETKKAAEAQRIADAKLAEARLARCRAWNAAMFMGGPAQPSPSIEDALLSGHDLIEVRCNKCNRIERVPLAGIRRRKETPLHTLEASFGCEPCHATHRFKPKAHIIGLVMSKPPEEPPPAASRQETA
jgi:hypothetical protein